MRQERNNIFAEIDWLLVFLFAILVGFGWMNIYAASKTEDTTQILDFSTNYGKQILWIILSVPLIVIILFFNSKFYEKYSSIFYIISLIVLILSFPFGKEINGAKSWFSFGGISLQPSEFVKAFTALAVSKLLSDRQYNLGLIPLCLVDVYVAVSVAGAVMLLFLLVLLFSMLCVLPLVWMLVLLLLLIVLLMLLLSLLLLLVVLLLLVLRLSVILIMISIMILRLLLLLLLLLLL